MNTYSVEIKDNVGDGGVKYVTVDAPDALTAINNCCGLQPAPCLEFTARRIEGSVMPWATCQLHSDQADDMQRWLSVKCKSGILRQAAMQEVSRIRRSY